MKLQLPVGQDTCQGIWSLFWVTLLGSGVDIEAVLMVFITGSFHLFKRRTEMSLQFIKESGTEGIAEKSVIEMFYIAPVGIVTVAAL